MSILRKIWQTIYKANKKAPYRRFLLVGVTGLSNTLASNVDVTITLYVTRAFSKAYGFAVLRLEHQKI